MGGLPSSTGQLPSAADGSRIDAIPNGRIASAANTNGRAGRWGGPPSMYAVWSCCRISGPSAPRLRSTRCGPCQSAAWDARRHLRGLGTCVPWFPAHWAPGIGVRTSQGPWRLRPPSRPLQGCVSGPSAPALPADRIRALGTCALSLPPCLEAWGEACQGPRHLRYPPLTQFPGGRPPPCPTECPRFVGVRGEGDGGFGVLCCVGLHSHPRAREGEMPETSGASQVHLRLSMEVLLCQLRNLERSRPPAAPHCDSICVQ